MNLEQLQALSNAELNELSAVKVMEKLYQNGKMWDKVEDSPGHRLIGEWNPTTDMNDAMELFEVMISDEDYNDATITYPYFIVAGWRLIDGEASWEIQVEDEKLSRAITIASILAKE